MKKRVLVGCEYSGTVRDAFLALGFDALSCDLLPTDVPGPHYQGDVFDIIGDGWDLAVFHPPCTYLCNSGAKHLYKEKIDSEGNRYRSQERDPARWAAMEEAADFYRRLWECPVPRVAIENPIMLGHARALIGIGKSTQIIQPWMFGHGETKATGLHLRGLPNLVPTNIVDGREAKVHRMPPGPDRWKLRSTTYKGIAEAMADQWGTVLQEETK